MGMILKKSTGKATKAHGLPLTDYKDKDGNPLPKEIKYDYEWYEYADHASMREAKDELSDKEQLKARNVERKTTARGAANTAALELAGIVKPDLKNSPLMRLRSVYNGLFAQYSEQGMAEADAHLKARKKSAEILEIEWPDEDEDQ